MAIEIQVRDWLSILQRHSSLPDWNYEPALLANWLSKLLLDYMFTAESLQCLANLLPYKYTSNSILCVNSAWLLMYHHPILLVTTCSLPRAYRVWQTGYHVRIQDSIHCKTPRLLVCHHTPLLMTTGSLPRAYRCLENATK